MRRDGTKNCGSGIGVGVCDGSMSLGVRHLLRDVVGGVVVEFWDNLITFRCDVLVLFGSISFPYISS